MRPAGSQPAPQGSIAATENRRAPAFLAGESACPTKIVASSLRGAAFESDLAIEEFANGGSAFPIVCADDITVLVLEYGG